MNKIITLISGLVAAAAFRSQGKKDRAANAYEKLSACLEQLGQCGPPASVSVSLAHTHEGTRPRCREYTAAKQLEVAATMAKDAGDAYSMEEVHGRPRDWCCAAAPQA